MIRNFSNERPNPECLLIVEANSRRNAIGAAVTQEIAGKDCNLQQVFIYGVS